MKCEVCGSPFVDKHRLWPGKHRGEYDDSNIAHLCPSHHRMAHHYMSVLSKLDNSKKISGEDAEQWNYLFQDQNFLRFIEARVKPILGIMPEIGVDFGSDEANAIAEAVLGELYQDMMK